MDDLDSRGLPHLRDAPASANPRGNSDQHVLGSHFYHGPRTTELEPLIGKPRKSRICFQDAGFSKKPP
jgi:hypothetical protein